MDVKQIRDAIKHEGVNVYIAYLTKLEKEVKNGQPVNAWVAKTHPEVFISFWNKCAAMGLTIDGDTVTLIQRYGAVTLSFDYHAYKNVVLNKYPETIFDHQLVYANDQFSFKKENGKVVYSHKIGNPFDTSRELIGAYAVIKNSTGEFIEFVHQADIEKMRASSKSSNIWTQWYDRMVLKSVIKRICNVNFKDIVKEIDTIDNEDYAPENLTATDYDQIVHKAINEVATFVELKAIFAKEKDLVKDQKALIDKISQARSERFEVRPGTPLWDKVCADIVSGGATVAEIKASLYITEENIEKLIEYATKNL